MAWHLPPWATAALWGGSGRRRERRVALRLLRRPPLVRRRPGCRVRRRVDAARSSHAGHL